MLVAGMLMDLVSPLFPLAFVFIVCLRSISRLFSKVLYTPIHCYKMKSY